MNLDWLQTFCNQLPGTIEDIKWGNDLCFTVGEKMYAVTGLEGDFKVSMKVLPEEAAELSLCEGIIPAPYLARYHWVLVEDAAALSKEEWEYYLRQSYELVFSKLKKSIQQQISNE